VDACERRHYTSQAVLEAVEKAVCGAAGYIYGTYRAQVDSFGGLLEIEVVVEGGRIEAVNVLEHSDTPGSPTRPMRLYQKAIVEANSAQVEAASGLRFPVKRLVRSGGAGTGASFRRSAVEPFAD